MKAGYGELTGKKFHLSSLTYSILASVWENLWILNKILPCTLVAALRRMWRDGGVVVLVGSSVYFYVPQLTERVSPRGRPRGGRKTTT